MIEIWLRIHNVRKYITYNKKLLLLINTFYFHYIMKYSYKYSQCKKKHIITYNKIVITTNKYFYFESVMIEMCQ